MSLVILHNLSLQIIPYRDTKINVSYNKTVQAKTRAASIFIYEAHLIKLTIFVDLFSQLNIFISSK